MSFWDPNPQQDNTDWAGVAAALGRIERHEPLPTVQPDAKSQFAADHKYESDMLCLRLRQARTAGEQAGALRSFKAGMIRDAKAIERRFGATIVAVPGQSWPTLPQAAKACGVKLR